MSVRTTPALMITCKSCGEVLDRRTVQPNSLPPTALPERCKDEKGDVRPLCALAQFEDAAGRKSLVRLRGRK